MAKYLKLDKSTLLHSLKESMDKPTPYKIVDNSPFIENEIKNFDLEKFPFSITIHKMGVLMSPLESFL